MQKKSLIKSRAAAKKALLASKKNVRLGSAGKGSKIAATEFTASNHTASNTLNATAVKSLAVTASSTSTATNQKL